jgi:hypothetical protein
VLCEYDAEDELGALDAWFAPRIDHWVKTTFEGRKGGRLMTEAGQTLLEYKAR